MDKRVTISDIAKEVGVSKTTISRYLNGNYGFMSAETKQKVADVIALYDYAPNSVARSLKSKKSNLIGVIVNALRYQVGAKTIMGINDVCATSGYGTIVCCSNDDPREEDAAIQRCINQQVDGLIIIPCRNDAAYYEKLCERGIPVVLCTRMLENWPYGCAYVNHSALILQMLKHLKQQGFEKVRLFYDVDNFHKLRMADTVAQFAKKNFDMEPEKSTMLVGKHNERLYQELDRYLIEYPNERKAVFAVNTNLLFVTLKRLEELKIKIPDELGVCGYDVIGWSELVTPGVSSIYQPMYEMGKAAGEEMVASIREGRMSSAKIALDGQIYCRNSTKLG